MKEEETINVLRHYRHDWLNQVQLLMGYASMGKLDKVEDKLKESLEVIEQERKITNLHMPKTALWIIGFNWRYDNFRINYQVEVDNKNLSETDDLLHKQLDAIITILKEHTDDMNLYNGTITFKRNEQNEVAIEVAFLGNFKQITNLESQLLEIEGIDHVTFTSKDEDNECIITWTCN